jgi:predicted aldo/keto reductase-like oxidoreductase
VSAIKSCDGYGECERKCPYGLPIIEILKGMVVNMEDMLRIWNEKYDLEY